MQVSVYIHIPFCQTKCPYCDFNSYVGCEDTFDDYVEAVCAEMTSLAQRSRRAGAGYTARTLYLGGGTPSLLAPSQVERLLAQTAREFGWHRDVETTVEANPGTIDEAFLRHLRECGVNRISLGVQSFDDVLLSQLGRGHSAREAVDAIEACRKAGFTNLNIDLIYGIPGQDVDQWRRTVLQAICLAPDHLSLYPLTLEPNTSFHERAQSGDLVMPNEDDVAQMYELAEEMLASAGYEHYEISNWAKVASGFSGVSSIYRCQHNLVYWLNEPYVGLGAGAHSYVNGVRYHNAMLPQEYIRLVEARGDAVVFRENISKSLEMAETMMLSLRLTDGLSRSTFRERFGCDPEAVAGLALSWALDHLLLTSDSASITLTPRGRLLANEVFVRIFSELTQED